MTQVRGIGSAVGVQAEVGLPTSCSRSAAAAPIQRPEYERLQTPDKPQWSQLEGREALG